MAQPDGHRAANMHCSSISLEAHRVPRWKLTRDPQRFPLQRTCRESPYLVVWSSLSDGTFLCCVPLQELVAIWEADKQIFKLGIRGGSEDGIGSQKRSQKWSRGARID